MMLLRRIFVISFKAVPIFIEFLLCVPPNLVNADSSQLKLSSASRDTCNLDELNTYLEEKSRSILVIYRPFRMTDMLFINPVITVGDKKIELLSKGFICLLIPEGEIEISSNHYPLTKTYQSNISAGTTNIIIYDLDWLYGEFIDNEYSIKEIQKNGINNHVLNKQKYDFKPSINNLGYVIFNIAWKIIHFSVNVIGFVGSLLLHPNDQSIKIENICQHTVEISEKIKSNESLPVVVISVLIIRLLSFIKSISSNNKKQLESIVKLLEEIKDKRK